VTFCIKYLGTYQNGLEFALINVSISEAIVGVEHPSMTISPNDLAALYYTKDYINEHWRYVRRLWSQIIQSRQYI
jgi:hypothetical protein